MNQVMITNLELNGKDIEITTLKLQNDKMRNELRVEKYFFESFKKPSESIKYFEKLILDLKMILLDWDTLVLRKENHLKVVNEETKKLRTTNPLVIILESQIIQKMFIGEEMQIRTLRRDSRVTIISAKRKYIRHMNGRSRP